MAKKNDLPAMPFYVGDWLKCPEVRSLNFELRGIWFEMMCYMWESTERGVLVDPSGSPYTSEDLSNMLGLPEDLLKQKLKQMESKKIFSLREPDGAIYCRRMVRDEDIRVKRSESGKKGGVVSTNKRFDQAKVQANTKANSKQNTENENENENENSINTNTSSEVKNNFLAFWLCCPRKEEMEAARIEFEAILERKEATTYQLLNSMSAYNAYCMVEYPDDYPLSQFIKKPKNWLKDKNWTEKWAEKVKQKNSKQSFYGTNVFGGHK